MTPPLRRRAARPDSELRTARVPRQRFKRLSELAFCAATIGLLLAWGALAVLGSVDIDGTAKLFSGIDGSAWALLNHV